MMKEIDREVAINYTEQHPRHEGEAISPRRRATIWLISRCCSR